MIISLSLSLLTSGWVDTCFSLLSAVTTNWANSFLRMSSPGDEEDEMAAISSLLLVVAMLPALAITPEEKNREKKRRLEWEGKAREESVLMEECRTSSIF